MDILKKMFTSESEKKPDGTPTNKDEFRKPQWFEEAETDDELFDDDRKFAFQVFTNPVELQKHFERQMQRMLESLNDLEENKVAVDRDLKEDFLKPGFESKLFKEFERKRRSFIDTDLDGEIYADQLHSLIQRLNPDGKFLSQDNEPDNVLPPNKRATPKFFTKPKLSDEEQIMGRIHGTITAEDEGRRQRKSGNGRPDIITPMTPMSPRSNMTPFGGVFDGSYQGPKMFSQNVMTKTIRKPDGTYETTKVTQDSTGNKTTTITRIVDGKKETITKHDGPNTVTDGNSNSSNIVSEKKEQYLDRNIFVTKEGYAMPRNLW